MKLFLFRDGGVAGPFEEETVREALRRGEIPGDAQVCYDGEDVWHPIAVTLGITAARSPSSPSPPLAARDEKYWAFISYSHKDKAIGDWLHKKLESYRIPPALAGRLGRNGVIPERLFPIFRDREELPTSSNLSLSIQEALAASRYLIVICSPRSAVSQWVNAEILAFDSMGKRDHILALIIEGEPHATEKNLVRVNECFPPALRFAPARDGQDFTEPFEPIASDIRPGGDSPERALLRILAGLLGVNFDELFQRERRRKRQRQVFACVLLAVVLLLAAGLLHWNLRLQSGQTTVVSEVEHLKNRGLGHEFGKLSKERQAVLDKLLQDLSIERHLSEARQHCEKSRQPIDSDIQKLEQLFADLKANIGKIKEFERLFAEAVQTALNVVDETRDYPQSSFEGPLESISQSISAIRQFAQTPEERVVADQFASNYQQEIARLREEATPKFASDGIRSESIVSRLETLRQTQAKRLHLYPTGPDDWDYPRRGGGTEEDDRMDNMLRKLALDIDPIKGHYNRGVAKQLKGELDGAIVDYNRAIELDPNDAFAYHNRGFAKQAKGDLEGAIADYDRDLALDPQHTKAYINRGEAKDIKGDLDGALADYNRALELDPKDADIYFRRGVAHFVKRNWTGALADFRHRCELDWRDQDYPRFFIWLIRTRLGENEEANKELATYTEEHANGGFAELVEPPSPSNPNPQRKKRPNDAPDDWGPKVANFLLDKTSEADFLAAVASPDAEKETGQHCESWFYAGMKRLLTGDQKTAADYFHKCLTTEKNTFLEYRFAASELKALGK